MPVDPSKHALQSLVSPVQMYPLGKAEAEHHIILRCLGLHQLISIQHVVTLRERSTAALRAMAPHIHSAASLCSPWPKSSSIPSVSLFLHAIGGTPNKKKPG